MIVFKKFDLTIVDEGTIEDNAENSEEEKENKIQKGFYQHEDDIPNQHEDVYLAEARSNIIEAKMKNYHERKLFEETK